jgi:hypothetical protein
LSPGGHPELARNNPSLIPDAEFSAGLIDIPVARIDVYQTSIALAALKPNADLHLQVLFCTTIYKKRLGT